METKIVKYFTTRYTWQMVLCSLLYIGVNIIMYGIFLDGTVLGMLVMVIIQTGILNGILNYLIWGIVRTRKWRLQAAKLASLALCNAALILGRVHTTEKDTNAGQPNKRGKHNVAFVIPGSNTPVCF